MDSKLNSDYNPTSYDHQRMTQTIAGIDSTKCKPMPLLAIVDISAVQS